MRLNPRTSVLLAALAALSLGACNNPFDHPAAPAKPNPPAAVHVRHKHHSAKHHAASNAVHACNFVWQEDLHYAGLREENGSCDSAEGNAALSRFLKAHPNLETCGMSSNEHGAPADVNICPRGSAEN
jgi:hypothetical protein